MSTFGEPWSLEDTSTIPYNRKGEALIDVMNYHDYMNRAIDCVNALSGIANPAEFVANARELSETVKELAEAVDNAERDIGGSRPVIDILRDAVVTAECIDASGKETK